MTTNHPAHGPVSLERLHQIREILSKAAAQSDGGNLGYAMADAVKVIDGVIAAFGAEPVADVVAWSSPNEERTCDIRLRRHDIAPGPLYSAPPAPVLQPVMFIDGDISASDAEKLAAVIREWDDAPAPERDQVRREHAAWSQATFGDVGPVGPLKHLSKEALEAAAEPGDLSEWADMQFLLWDAQRRAGISDEQINQAMVEKLVVNKQRKWPEPKDGEPRLHIKEQPAPVVPDGYCIMPVALTAKNGAKWALSGEFSTAREVTCPECEGDGCSDCDGRGDWYEDQAIDWTTIKEIYRRAVEVCALPTGQTQDKIA